MVKSLVIHIGDPKTGTTSLQSTLHERKYAMKGPSIFYGPRFNGNRMAGMIYSTQNHREQKIFNMLRRYAQHYNNSDSDIGVFSAESLAWVDPSRAKKIFLDLFDIEESKIRIVCYLKPHCDFFLSRFSQHVKNGLYSGTMDKYCRFVFSKMNYSERMHRWQDSFPGQVEVYPYSRRVLLNSDISFDFFKRVLSPDQLNIQQTYRWNISPSVRQLSICRQYYIDLFGYCDNDIRGLRKFPKSYVKIHKYFERTNNAGATGDKLRLHSSLSEKIYQTFESDAMAIDKLLNTEGFFLKALSEGKDEAIREPQDLRLEANFSKMDALLVERLLLCIRDQNPAEVTNWNFAPARRLGIV